MTNIAASPTSALGFEKRSRLQQRLEPALETYEYVA
jgi:hypothetical protein